MKTIKDIAIEANVSAGTVDRVIHNRPGVSKKTRRKIEELLEKYNFERNVLASTLAYKRKYIIAVLMPSYDSNADFWYEPYKGVRSAIDEIKKFRVEVHQLYFEKLDQKSFKYALQQILNLSPDGVVLAPFFYKTSLNFTRELTKRKIPFVFINIDIESQHKLTFIGQDSYYGGFMAGKLLNLLLRNGEQIAIARSGNVDNHHAIDARVQGFLDYFSKNHFARKTKEIYFNKFSRKETSSVLDKELASSATQGIFVPSSMSFHVARYLEENHLDCIHLVGFDAHINNLKYLKSDTIDFLIDQDPVEQGYMGVKVMFEYLLFKKTPRKKYNSPINIVSKENASFFRSPVDVEVAV